MSVDLSGYQLFLAVAFFLAGCHAHAKLSPYFAATWFGSGLVFAYVWGGRSSALEVVLLPALVFYMAAAATKGLVETRPSLAGNHVVHVLATGLFSGVVAMPILAAAAAAGWTVPGARRRSPGRRASTRTGSAASTPTACCSGWWPAPSSTACTRPSTTSASAARSRPWPSSAWPPSSPA